MFPRRQYCHVNLPSTLSYKFSRVPEVSFAFIKTEKREVLKYPAKTPTRKILYSRNAVFNDNVIKN